MKEAAFSVRTIAMFSSLTLLLGVFIGYTVGPVTVGQPGDDDEFHEETPLNDDTTTRDATHEELQKHIAELQDKLVEENYRFLTAKKRAELLEQELQGVRKNPGATGEFPEFKELTQRLTAFQSWLLARNSKLADALKTASTGAAHSLRDEYWKEVTTAAKGLRADVLADPQAFATWVDAVSDDAVLSLMFGEVLAGMSYSGGMMLYNEQTYSSLPETLRSLVRKWLCDGNSSHAFAALALLRHLREVPEEIQAECHRLIGSTSTDVTEAALAMLQSATEFPASLLDTLLAVKERNLSSNAKRLALRVLALVDDKRAIERVTEALQAGSEADAIACAQGLQQRSAQLQLGIADAMSASLLAAFKQHESVSARVEFLCAGLALPTEQAIATCKGSIPLLSSTEARTLVQNTIDRLERGDPLADVIRSFRSQFLSMK